MSTKVSPDDLRRLWLLNESKDFVLALSSKWVTCPHCGFETPVSYPYLDCDCSVCHEIF